MPDLNAIVSGWYTAAIGFLPNLLLIALILTFTIVVSRRVQGLVRRLSQGTQAPREIGDLLGRIARIAILLIGTLLILGQVGLSSAVLSFVAGLGVAGIVIGFALQDIVKHFAAGVLLLMLRPFRIGDEVRIGAFEGRVEDVQLRATVLRTKTGDEVLIPNADVYNSAIVNLSRYNLHRHTVKLQLPADQDLLQTRAALTQALGAVAGVAAQPPPSVAATTLEGQTATIELRFWVDERATEPGAVTTDVIAAARQALAGQAGEVKG